jgi:hypothetical protein
MLKQRYIGTLLKYGFKTNNNSIRKTQTKVTCYSTGTIKNINAVKLEDIKE